MQIPSAADFNVLGIDWSDTELGYAAIKGSLSPLTDIPQGQWFDPWHALKNYSPSVSYGIASELLHTVSDGVAGQTYQTGLVSREETSDLKSAADFLETFQSKVSKP